MNHEAMYYATDSIPHSLSGGRESAVGIATRYGQVDQGSNPGGGGGRLSVTVLTGPEAHSASCKMGNRVYFPSVK
jgi:hypothetical protein